MTTTIRQAILRANAIFLLIAAAGGIVSDVLGIFFARGPVASIAAAAPHAGIGFVEAHGLAFIIGVLLWRAEPLRTWHLAAAAVHVLLGTANLVFWTMFVAADMLVVGYVTTTLHALFATTESDVVDAITRGCEPKPQALAAWLRVSVADVNNRIKRLRRLAFKIDRGEARRMTG